MMKTDLTHLPEKKQKELHRVVEILHVEFQAAIAGASQQWKHQARIQRIVLFGSYARNDWVDESYSRAFLSNGDLQESLKDKNSHQNKVNGYMSDFDLLIIVNQKRLTDVAEFWYKAEDRLITDEEITTPVNFIVHTMQDVNQALSQGQYFFSDIVKEGIELYFLKGAKRFITPKPLNDAEAYKIAKEYFDYWFNSAVEFNAGFEFYKNRNNYNKAAFLLHQTTENLYSCVLLVLTNYTPNSHNIKFLRSLAENHDARLMEAWPHEEKRHKALFEILKEAYVKARYSKYYAIKTEDLEWLASCVERLMHIVEIVCKERLKELQLKNFNA